MGNKYCIVMTTASSQDEADKLMTVLLNKRLSACVQQSVISSSYHWKDKIEKSSEILLIIKTRENLFSEIETLIKANHSYETPEIIMLPITNGSEEYLSWIKNETK